MFTDPTKNLEVKKGFTLIELLVVIAIIGILASVVVASVNSARERGRIGGGVHFEEQIEHVAGELLMAKWDFDECPGAGTATTVLDTSGFSRNGTPNNSPLWSLDTPTGRGCSLSFNGSNQYISFPSFPAWGGDFTVSGWVKPTALSIWSRLIDFGNGSTADNIYFTIAGNSGTPTLGLFNGSTSVMGPGATGFPALSPIQTGRWAFIVATMNGTTASIYIDGKHAGNLTGSAWNSVARTNNYIGRSNWADAYYSGLMDNVRIFNKSLVAREVEELYAMELNN